MWLGQTSSGYALCWLTTMTASIQSRSGRSRPSKSRSCSSDDLKAPQADRWLIRLLELAEEIHVPAAVVARTWRNPARQAKLGRVLAADPVVVHPLDIEIEEAMAVGHLAARPPRLTSCMPVLIAHRVDGVAITSDAADLRLIGRHVELVTC